MGSRFIQSRRPRLRRVLPSVLLFSAFAGLLPAQLAPSAEDLEKYDRNKNGRLDADELRELERARRQAPPPADTSNSEADPQVVQLSPFEVSAESNGYYASNTTSSTRLNTSLDDLATATTIVTKEMMQDFAMLDINDIFAYEAGTEGSGTFTDAAVDRNGSPIDVTSTNPNVANRVRGMGSANMAIGNFASNGFVPVDPINIDGVEINRGPNSSIFGLGEVSGTVNLQPASANLFRDRSTVGVRTDSYGGYRGSLDLNRVLVRGKLAIRGSAVYQHDGFVREPAGVNSRRLNAMIRMQPFRKTTISASYSVYDSWGTMDNKTMPKETITSWQAAGSPTWDPITATAKINGVPVAGTWTTTTLPSYFQASQMLTLSSLFVQQDGSVSWWGPSRTTTNTTTPAASQNQNVFYVNPVYAQPSPAQPLFATDPAMSDKSIYDYTSINLAALNRTEVSQKTGNVQLEQIFFNTPRQLLALQVAGFKEDGKRSVDNMWGTGGSGGRTGYIYVDVNERLLDGSPNPNLGRPFVGIYNIRAKADSYNDRKTGRTQLAYRLDLRREPGFMKWLGMHTVTGYAEYRQTRTRIGRWQDEMLNSQTWRVFPTTPTIVNNFTTTPVAAQPFYRYYIGDANGQNVDYAPHAVIPGFYDFSWGNGLTGVFRRDRAELGTQYYPSNTNGWTKNTLKTQGGALQSYFWKDRIITTVGLRRDRTWDLNPAARQFVFDQDGYHLIEDSLNVLNNNSLTMRSGRTTTLGVVVKPLPWLRVYANKSDSFLPASLAQVGLFRNLLPNPTGEGEDYGIGLQLFGGKLVMRLNKYETLKIQDRNNNGGTLAQRVHGIDLTTTYAPPGLVNLARGWVTRAAATAGETLSEDELNRRISDIAKLDPVYWTDPQSNSLVYAPSDTASKGYEFELNYNPSRYWTVKFNATQMEATDKNLSQDITNWINERMPVWESIIDPELGVPFFTERYGATVSAKEFLQASVLAPLAVAQANEGKSLPQVRKYRANLSTRFLLSGVTDHQWLKAVAVGGALRWEDKGSMGYYGIADSAGIYTALDPTRPIYDSSHTYVDLFLSYRTKLWRNKIGATFQLNIKNVQESGRLQAITALPDGTPSAYRIVDPRQFVLTMSFDL